jgi:hypothetical protein
MGKLLENIWRICREKGLTQYYPHEEEITESDVQGALYDSKQLLWQEPKFHRAVEQGIRQFQADRAAIDFNVNRNIPKSKPKPKFGFHSEWFRKDKLIMKNLSRKKNKHLFRIGEIIQDSHIQQGNKDEPVLSEIPYEKIQQELGISILNIKHYLRAMERWELIKKTNHRTKERGAFLWSLGTWLEVQTRNGTRRRPLYFVMQSPEVKRKLREFDADLCW